MTTALKVDGVDISHHQSGKIDYRAAIKAGVKWMYHKATEGTSFKDASYGKRRLEARSAGLPFGAYHFARPSRGRDAQLEAQYFIGYARPLPGDLRPALDLETQGSLNRSELLKWADAFCAEVERLTGVVPVIYTPYVLSDALQKKAILWRPRYNNTNTPPAEVYDIWQFSNGRLGVPNHVPGFGNVDLNTSKVGLDKLLMPTKKPAVPEKPTTPTGGGSPVVSKQVGKLRIAHISLQYNDSNKQHTADITKLFSQGYDHLTGTEAGPGTGNTHDELIRIAALKGYYLSIHRRYGSWVAIKKSIVVPGTFEKGAEFAVWRSSRIEPAQPGHWGDKAVAWASYKHKELGRVVSQAAVHNVTHKGTTPAMKKKLDKQYASVVGDWAGEKSAGSGIAFVNGDFNLIDKRVDVFFGHPLTTCWDELKKWPSTGHGNIDAIASVDKDTRVRCKRANVLNDKELFLNTDHFLCVTVYEVL